MIDILKAAVYCGTYGKYAKGDLSGAWIQLAKYKTSCEFLDACGKLHNDENEPEFMYQDKENLPDEYYSESCIYPEAFAVIAAIKAMSEDEQNAFEEYCDQIAAIPEMFDIEEFKANYKNAEQSQTKTKTGGVQTTALEELLALLKARGRDCKGYYIAAIKIRDGYFAPFTKQDIEKSFCWGYSDFGQGMTQEEAEETCRNFGEKEFKEYNLADFDCNYKDELKWLDSRKDVTLVYPEKNDDDAFTWCDVKTDYGRTSPNELTLKGEEADRFREEYKKIVANLRADFEKKIDSYLKRYGVSKIRKWTFWADE